MVEEEEDSCVLDGVFSAAAAAAAAAAADAADAGPDLRAAAAALEEEDSCVLGGIFGADDAAAAAAVAAAADADAGPDQDAADLEPRATIVAVAVRSVEQERPALARHWLSRESQCDAHYLRVSSYTHTEDIIDVAMQRPDWASVRDASSLFILFCY